MNELIKPTFYTREAPLYHIGAAVLPWIDAETSGRMLHPEAKDPADTIQKIYNRNKAVFTDRDTVLLEVDATHLRAFNRGDLEGRSVPPDQAQKEITQKRKMRFFSVPDGFAKLNLISKSSRKIQISEWIIRTAIALHNGTLPRHDGTLTAVATLPRWSHERAAGQKQIAAESGLSENTIRRHLRAIEDGRPIVKSCPGAKKGYFHRKHREKHAEVLKLRNEGLRLHEIHERTGISLATVARWCAKKCR